MLNEILNIIDRIPLQYVAIFGFGCLFGAVCNLFWLWLLGRWFPHEKAP